MKKHSTTFLKFALVIIGLPVLILSIFIAVNLIKNKVNEDYVYIIYPLLTGIYISAIPFYSALYKAFRLLKSIDNNTAFSQDSVNNLKSIKYSANTIVGIYILIMPFIYLFADKDDAPGLIIFWVIPLFASMIISVFSAVLQRLLQEAINIKTENDLTV